MSISFRATALAAFGIVAACKSTPVNQAALAELNDPRMKCAQAELATKGYDVDRSFRRPGRIVATRVFTTGDRYRAAISAQLDSTDNALEVWTRVIRRDETPVSPTYILPPNSMVMDALQVENLCADRK
jgi:hypothetical protein